MTHYRLPITDDHPKRVFTNHLGLLWFDRIEKAVSKQSLIRVP